MTTGPGGSVRCRSLRVLPRSRGSWIVATEQDDVLSEHATANEAAPGKPPATPRRES
jgi:hypothetical protein